jgi:predicted metal-dependent hydrolase
LFGKTPDQDRLAQYRHYLNRADIRRSLHNAKRERGRKAYSEPRGAVYDLAQMFAALNHEYFHGLMAAPALGWSLRPSRTILGHYDPSHHVIVLSRSLDSSDAPERAVRFVLFHEMLHLRYPTENRGARRCVHTPQFKQAEREFVDYAEAKEALKKFVRQQP